MEKVAIKAEEGSSLKIINEQFDSVVSQLKLDIDLKERKKLEEEDKKSEQLAKKLSEEDAKEEERRKKSKEEQSKELCKLCRDPIEPHELYAMEGCDNIFHSECIRTHIMAQVRIHD